MIYLDNGATSFPKPVEVQKAVLSAMQTCANPGRSGHKPAMAGAETVFRCREQAAALFHCQPEQVVLTSNCTHSLNIAIRSLVSAGVPVLISGFEHNAVTRPLHALGADVRIAGRRLFDWPDTLEKFENGLKRGAKVAVFTHVSNVFGYILPVEQMAELCRQYHVPFVIDAAQSAGYLPVDLEKLGANYIAMPGHKGLLGPMGTGILLCGDVPAPLLIGGTGSQSLQQDMPDFLPDRAEAGTLNVPGIAGLSAGINYVNRIGTESILYRQRDCVKRCAAILQERGFWTFAGAHQAGTVSFLPNMDCQLAADILAQQNIAVRAGLHCAPLAHESAGTLSTGTVRVSFGHEANATQVNRLARALSKLS